MKARPLSRYLARLIWLSVLPLVLFATGMAALTIVKHERDIQEQAADLTNNAITDVDNYLDSRIKALGILAASPFADEPEQWERLYRLALDFHRNFGSHVLFADIGEPMKMIFNTRSPFGSSLPAIPKPEGHAAAPAALETGRPAVGDTFTGPVTGTKLVAIAVPGLRKGVVRHLLISPMATSEFQARIEKISLPRQWRLTLVDGTGDVIARNAPPASQSPETGLESVSFSGALSAAPWSVRVDIPKSVYMAPLWREAAALLITMILALLAGVVLSMRASNRLTRQIQALTAPTQTTSPSSITEIAEVQDRLSQDLFQLRESERRHRELFEANPHPMWVYDVETLAFLEVNEAAIYQYGYSRAEFLGMTIKDIRPPEDVERLLGNVAKISKGLNDTGSIWRHQTKGGRVLDVEIMSHFLLFEGRQAELVLAHNVTEQVHAKKALQVQARQQLLIAQLGHLALSAVSIDDIAEEAVKSTADGLSLSFGQIILFDAQRSTFVIKAGKGWHEGWIGTEVTDPVERKRAFAVFRSSTSVRTYDFNSDTYFADSGLMKRHGIVSGVDVLVGQAEKPLGVLGAYSSVRREFSNEDIGFLQGIANTLAAVIERHRTADQLNHMAVHDSVTDLPNRLLMTDRLDIALHHAERTGHRVALLLVDIDRFKNVNDIFGHLMGDHVLHEVGQRLSHCIRAEDTVSRQNGDEFIIVLPELAEAQDAARIAEKFIGSLTAPFTFDDQEIILGVSIGIACFPDNGRDVETLTRNADAAMHFAQGLGRNRYQFYSPDMNERTLELVSLERDLQFAVERKELFLTYQPQVSLRTGEIVGLEALVRWLHPDRGLISPAQFIPVAEESGLIVDIGTWVLRTACRQHALWMKQGIISGTIAVNVSAHQFRQPNFIETVKETLLQCGLDPEYLELELTESVVMHGVDDVARKLDELEALGIKLAIDDFGTGYSSLSYLKQFPLFRLKIDQSFTRGLPEDEEDGAIAKAIIQLGHSLGLEVIAEGIETREQKDFLRALLCNSGQGYLFAKPLGVEECAEFLKQKPYAAMQSKS